MSIVRALAQRWNATLEPGGLRGTLDGAPFRARVTEGALIQLALDAIDVPGFDVTIAPRHADDDPDDHVDWVPLTEYVAYRGARGGGVREAFLRRFAVRASDRGLVRLWLDDVTREALLAAPERYTLAGGTLTVAPFAAIGLDGFERTLRAAARIVTRPHRLATAWREAIAPLGAAIVPDAWDTEDFEIVAGELRIDTPWRPDAVDGDRLRTRIVADRHGARADFALWRPSLDDELGDHAPATLPPALADRYRASGATHRLIAHAARVSAAAPDAVIAAGDHVSLWWRGLILDPRRLASAAALTRALANDPDSPYR